MQKLISESKYHPLTTALQFPLQQVHFLDQYHHGGYAKTSKELIDFINFFNQTNQFLIEPTYTGKTLYALSQELPKFQPSIKNVLFIHTGGVL